MDTKISRKAFEGLCEALKDGKRFRLMELRLRQEDARTLEKVNLPDPGVARDISQKEKGDKPCRVEKS